VDKNEMLNIIECVLFAAGDSVPIGQFCDLLNLSTDELEPIVTEEMERRTEAGSALIIKRFEDRLQLATNPKYMDSIVHVLGAPTNEDLSNSPQPARKLSNSAASIRVILSVRFSKRG